MFEVYYGKTSSNMGLYGAFGEEARADRYARDLAREGNAVRVQDLEGNVKLVLKSSSERDS